MGSKSNKKVESGLCFNQQVDNKTVKFDVSKLRDTLKLKNPSFGKSLNAKQAELKKAIKTSNIIIATGPSGTGKTYNALQTAFSIITSTDNPESPSKILLAKSVTTVKGEELGYLPGNVDEKLAEVMMSYEGNIDKIFAVDGMTLKLKEMGVIKYCPLAYLRGVQHDNAIVILDEAQNVTMDIFKTLITRLGKNSKIIFLGDVEQIDLSKKSQSCLSTIMHIFKDTDYVKVIEFKEEDCVRNPLIPQILSKLREHNY
ncbi:MAG: PhoH family protein [Bacteroidales bacterium]